MVKTLEMIERITDRWPKAELTGYYYDGIVGSATVECSPLEGQIWDVLSELKYVNELKIIGNIKKIELEFISIDRFMEDMENEEVEPEEPEETL